MPDKQSYPDRTGARVAGTTGAWNGFEILSNWTTSAWLYLQVKADFNAGGEGGRTESCNHSVEVGLLVRQGRAREVGVVPWARPLQVGL